MKYCFLAISLICATLPFSALYSQNFRHKYIESSTASSFRALSVADDNKAWVSGSNGWFGRTSDGGDSWEFDQIKLFQEMDLRILYAFDSQNAIVANAGSPAYILRTSDGGNNWLPVYQNSNPEIFLDGIDFWNEREGIIYGDPIDGKMVLLKTSDGGFTWDEFLPENCPPMLKGEASFAASGTGIRCVNEMEIYITSGGEIARLYHSRNKGQDWEIIEVPILHGANSTGIFSVAVKNSKQMIVVGGDYKNENQMKDHILISNNSGRKWKQPKTPTNGYRECVEYLFDDTYMATGPNGTDLSNDGGMNWTAIPDLNEMHVIRKARNGSLILLAGKKGKLAILNKID